MRPHPVRSALTLAVTPLVYQLMKPGFLHRRSHFESLGAAPGRVVFLGDSITEFGLWEEHFPAAPVLNRGIAGEISGQVLRRLDTAINSPRAVFLLIGTNDLSVGLAENRIVRNVAAILDGIETRAPGVPVYLQSVMPRTEWRRGQIEALNARYRGLAEARADTVRYLDLWPVLADGKGALRTEFTRDKLHLNGPGYRAWCGLLEPLVQSAAAGE
jgi:lysophospholipase L1-like esterase